MKKFEISGSYLEWEDYERMIRQREMINFITRTTKESLRNLILKEVV